MRTGWSIDIGSGDRGPLGRSSNRLNYANLDEVPAFKGKITTTEFLCHHIWEALRDAAKDHGPWRWRAASAGSR